MSLAKENIYIADVEENRTLVNDSSKSTQLTSLQIFEAFGLIVVIVVSLVLNVLLCSVVLRNKTLRKLATNIFILNLAISNALMAMCVIPFSFQAVVEKSWNHSDLFCQVNGMSSMTFCISSIATLCCISIDRYYAVVRPMRYKNMLTRNRAIYMLLFGWFLAILFSSAPVVGWGEYTYSPGTNHCSPNWKKHCGYHVFMACAVFVFPALILIFAYGKVVITVRKHGRRVSHWSACEQRITRSSCPCSFLELKPKLDNSSQSPTRLQIPSSANRSRTTTPLSKTNSLPQIRHNLIPVNEDQAHTDSKLRKERNFLSASNLKQNSEQQDRLPFNLCCPRPRSRTLSLRPGTTPRVSITSNNSLASLSTRNFMLRIRTLTRISKRFQNNLISVRSREYKIAKTGLLLVFVFFLSWGPYILSNNCNENAKLPLWLERLSMWLVYIGCLLNPLVYAFSSRHIQEAFVSVFLRCRFKTSKTNIRVQPTRSRSSVPSRTTLVNSTENQMVAWHTN